MNYSNFTFSIKNQYGLVITSLSSKEHLRSGLINFIVNSELESSIILDIEPGNYVLKLSCDEHDKYENRIRTVWSSGWTITFEVREKKGQRFSGLCGLKSEMTLI